MLVGAGGSWLVKGAERECSDPLHVHWGSHWIEAGLRAWERLDEKRALKNVGDKGVDMGWRGQGKG